ncbi:MAG TPA: outer membrane beta-barrel protein [Thermoanaerobaculia bacterium]
MKTRIAILVLAALAAAPFAFAQERTNVEINPFAGYLFGGKFARGTNALFTSDVDVDDHATFGGRLGFFVTRSFELELQYSRTETHFVTRDGGQLFGPGARRLGDLDIDYYLGYMTFNFGHNRRVIPYVTLGAGAARLDPKVPGTNVDSENKFTASLGAGLKTMFNRNVGLRFDGRYYATRLRNRDDRGGRCDGFFDNCNSDRRDWLTNGDVTGGLVIAF